MINQKNKFSLKSNVFKKKKKNNKMKKLKIKFKK